MYGVSNSITEIPKKSFVYRIHFIDYFLDDITNVTFCKSNCLFHIVLIFFCLIIDWIYIVI